MSDKIERMAADFLKYERLEKEAEQEGHLSDAKYYNAQKWDVVRTAEYSGWYNELMARLSKEERK